MLNQFHACSVGLLGGAGRRRQQQQLDHHLDKLAEDSTHKSAKIHSGNVFVTRDLDLCSFDLKINKFPGLIVVHFYVKFGDRICIGF